MAYKKNDDNNVYIYGLVDPRDNNVFYIGFTDNLKRRYAQHLNINSNRNIQNPYRNNVINKIFKLGLKPEIKIIDSCEYQFNSELNMFEHEILEINYIKKFREDGVRLTNLTNGGDGGCTYLRKVYQYSEDGVFIREFNSVNNVAEHYSVNANIISKAIDQRGKKSYHSTYLFSSLDVANEFKFKKTKKDNIPVIQYSSNGDFIGEFKSQKEASILTNIPQPNINHCLKKKRIHAGGFCWKYKENIK